MSRTSRRPRSPGRRTCIPDAGTGVTGRCGATLADVTPKVEMPKTVPGGLNCTRLKMLKASTRNWKRTRSVMEVFLASAKSKLFIPIARIFIVRGALPKPKDGGAVKHAVLNHLLSLSSARPSISIRQPGTMFGRGMPPPKVLLKIVGDAWKFNGNPLWNVVMPLIAQPEINLSATPLTVPRNFCPRPTGILST